MMKNILMTMVAFLMCLFGWAQNAEYRVVEAIRNGNMMELREAYKVGGDSVQTPFLKPVSEFLIAHCYNEPEMSVSIGNFLLEKYQGELIETEMLSTVVRMMSEDFFQLGDANSAANILEDYNEFYEQSGAQLFQNSEDWARLYRAISEQGGYKIEKPQKTIVVPLKYDSVPMIYVDVTVRSQKIRALYATSSSVNYMSAKLAKRLGVRMIDGKDYGSEVTHVIVDSLWMGDILYRNIPFYVTDFSTGNDKADVAVDDFQCMLSNTTLLGLGEVQFDLVNQQMIFPEHPSPCPDYAPNLCHSPYNTLVCPVYDYKTRKNIVATLDTGWGMNVLTYPYFDANRESFPDVVPNDTLNYVDINGVNGVPVCNTTLKIKIGDKVKELKDISLECVSEGTNVNSELGFGTPALFQFDKVIFNFKDMWIRME